MCLRQYRSSFYTDSRHHQTFGVQFLDLTVFPKEKASTEALEFITAHTIFLLL